MKTSTLFGGKTVLSLEVFPPKRTAPLKAISGILNELQTISPDFISVTHLPCLNLKKEEVLTLLDRLRALGIENILALRGDQICGRT